MNHAMNDKTSIEYLGINLRGNNVTKKCYYNWDGRAVPLPNSISKDLDFFDYGVREGEYEYSISAFVKADDIYNKLMDIIGFSIDNGIKINSKDHLLSSFKNVNGMEGDHYNPIVSFKVKQNSLAGVSFYVTVLKDKSKMHEFIDLTFNNVTMPKDKMPFINQCFNLKVCDMFQVSWDYSCLGNENNKVYLKVKKKTEFIDILHKSLPDVYRFSRIDGYRINQLAFVLSQGNFIGYNLYYKPL